MKLYRLLFLYLCLPNTAFADIKCDDFVGTWSNVRLDQKLNSERHAVKTMGADGSFWIKFIYDDGNKITEHEEFGTWDCNDSELSVVIKKINESKVYYYDVYEILELTNTYHSMTDTNPNCANIVGDCKAGLIYEYFKVLN